MPDNLTDVPHGSTAPVPGRCGAKLRKSDPPRYCKRRATRGATRCKIHGGHTPKGIASPHYKPDIYSTVLPPTVRADYHELLTDPALLSLKREIAVTRLRLKQQLAQTGTLAGPRLVEAAVAFFESWDTWQAARQQDAQAVKQATPKLELAAGRLREAADPERNRLDGERAIRADTLLLERLERSENLRVKELYDMISGERAYALRQAETVSMLEAIAKYVPDRATQDAIRRHVAAKFAELTGRGDAAPVDAAGGPEPEPRDPAATD